MSFGSIIHDMVIDMNETRLNTVAQLRAFLERTLEVKFRPIRNDVERYGFIAGVLGRFAYRQLGRADKGVVMRDLAAKIQWLSNRSSRTRNAAPNNSHRE
jgi:hypothetical protein